MTQPVHVPVCLSVSPMVATTTKNLSALYRRQGRHEVADTLDDLILKSKQLVSTASNDTLLMTTQAGYCIIW